MKPIDPDEVILTEDPEDLLQRVFKEIKEFSEPICISAFVDNVRVGEYIADLVKKGRVKIGRHALANIFGPFKVN